MSEQPQQERKLPFVVVQRVWIQTSADYNAELLTRTLIVSPDTTLEQIIEWSKAGSFLAMGDVVLTEPSVSSIDAALVKEAV